MKKNRERKPERDFRNIDVALSDGMRGRDEDIQHIDTEKRRIYTH